MTRDLKKDNLKLDLLTDINILLMIEKVIRDWDMLRYLLICES